MPYNIHISPSDSTILPRIFTINLNTLSTRLPPPRPIFIFAPPLRVLLGNHITQVVLIYDTTLPRTALLLCPLCLKLLNYLFLP